MLSAYCQRRTERCEQWWCWKMKRRMWIKRCRGKKCVRMAQTARQSDEAKWWAIRKRKEKRGWRTSMSTSCCANISAVALRSGWRQWENCKGVWGIWQSPWPCQRNPSQQGADREEGAGRKKSDLEGSWKELAVLHRFCQGTENRITLYTNTTRMFLVKLLILLMSVSHHYTALLAWDSDINH